MIHIIGQELFPYLAQETNKYATKELGTQEVRFRLEHQPHSRLHNWTETNSEEVIRFVAMMLSMALDKRSAVRGRFRTSWSYTFRRLLDL